MPYATLAELRAYVGIPVADVADDANLTLALDAATTQIDGWCDRRFTEDAAVVARYYQPGSSRYVDVDPITTLTGLVVKTDDDGDGVAETTWTVGTDFRVEPVNAAAEGKPWTRLVALGTKWFPRLTYRPGVEVTAKYGWQATVPQAVKQATLVQASRLFVRRQSPFGMAGSPDVGTEVRLLARLDPDVEMLLRPFRRTWWVLT